MYTDKHVQKQRHHTGHSDTTAYVSVHESENKAEFRRSELAMAAAAPDLSAFTAI